MNPDSRLRSAAAERNQGPIVAELKRLLPPAGLLLEIASGTGQHAAHSAAVMTSWRWQPSDADPSALASIEAWCRGLPNVMPPLLLDVLNVLDVADQSRSGWPGVPNPVDAIFCANMIHIAPWPVCVALMQGAARHLSEQGLLLLYGPFIVDGELTSDSNMAFDVSLRSRHDAWGLRRLADVLQEAQAAGLGLQERVAMPANNLLLVWQKT